MLQPENFKRTPAREQLRALQPDLLVVVAYGLILPQSVLDIPSYGCWNVHASLLPRWRGAAPIQRAIEAGDTRTGVCLMQMEKGLDTGPVLLSLANADRSEQETGGQPARPPGRARRRSARRRPGPVARRHAPGARSRSRPRA